MLFSFTSRRKDVASRLLAEPMESHLLLAFVASATVDTTKAQQGFNFALNQPVTGGALPDAQDVNQRRRITGADEAIILKSGLLVEPK